LEVIADTLCDVFLGREVVNEPESSPKAGIEPPNAVIDDTPLLVEFSFVTTGTDHCGGGNWWTCAANVTSPSCLTLFSVATSKAYLCSNDPQYLTVTASAGSLDFAYSVANLPHGRFVLLL
jgi:hypothetical protein